MNAMTNFTLRSLKANRVRTWVTIAGVALAAALLTAVLTSYASLSDFLYRDEAASGGTWMADVELDDGATAGEIAAKVKDASDVTGVATLTDVGFAQLTAEQQNRLGQYLPIVSASGELEELLALKPSEGRLPERPGEIMLYKAWQDYEDVQIGDALTFSVGNRQAVLAPGKEGSMAAGEVTLGFETDTDEVESTIVDGAVLNSSVGYLSAEGEGGSGIFNERLTNVAQRTYTVVGFYDQPGYALSNSTGTSGVTAADPDAAGFTEAYLSFSGVSNSTQVQERAEELLPGGHVVLHSAMLRYMGISSDSGLWDTFFGLVAVLAIVIAAACVSLIFNAFNISVAERVSQFGLLSSVGASRRQLRRAVVLEGLFVACIGVPLGVVVGLAGCAVTFAILAPSLASLAGGNVPFTVAVRGEVLGLAALLTVVTVLVSAWIPAKRASRINTIDALRYQGGSRASRKGARDAARNTQPDRLWSRRGAAGRIFGVGGVIARINRKRGTAKGRAASVSLALAIVLLLTAGSLNVFLGTLTGVVSGGEKPSEVGVTAAFDLRDAGSNQLKEGSSGANALVRSEEPLAPEDVLAGANESFAAFSNAYGYLSETPGADPVGWTLWNTVAVSMPPDMVGSSLLNGDVIDGGVIDNGDFGTMATLVYVEDGAFDSFVRSQGLDPADYHDAAHPRAVGSAQGYGNNGDMYQLLDVLRQPGTVDVWAAGVYQDDFPVYFTGATEREENGEIRYALRPCYMTEDGYGRQLNMEDVESAVIPLEVAAVVDGAPAIAGGAGSGVHLYAPMSLAQTQGFGCESPRFNAFFNSTDGDHVALTEALVERGSEFFHDDCPYDLAYYSYNDFIEEMNSTQMIGTVVNVFCLLFTIILALIAMANVFNTVTNSLILRRREFAVMRSVGLSNRQFRRMIMEECMHFGVGGLIPGLALSVFVSWLLYSMVSQSMTGLAFAIPWTYVALAVGMTALAMAISVAYGMHRCKADSVVEALRSDSV